MPWKWILCLAGLFLALYGMAADADAVFIVGIVLGVAGYLLVRKDLKRALPEEPAEPGPREEDRED